MTPDALFGDLRSILQQPASTLTWEALCQHLDLWSNDTLEQLALPYAAATLARWPAALSRSNARWVRDVIAGTPRPALALCDTFYVGGEDAWTKDSAIKAVALLIDNPQLKKLLLHRSVDARLLFNQLLAPHTPPLFDAIELRSCELPLKLLTTLTNAPHLRRVTSFSVSVDDWLGARGLRLLCDSPHAASLRHLAWTSADLRDGAAHIAASPHLTNLTALHLYTARLSAASAAALAASPNLQRLTHLDLNDNNIGPQGAAALAASPHLKHLTSLDLSQNSIGDAGAAALTASPHLSNLTHLALSQDNLGPSGAAALATSQHLQRLTHLSLNHNAIADGGARALASATNLPNLTSLDLYGNKIGDAGAAALAASPHLTNLTHLNLLNNSITERGRAALLASPHLSEPIRDLIRAQLRPW
jgi:Ran GTPase-activating protein (RanGAP) involved in mRNA processing and transport